MKIKTKLFLTLSTLPILVLLLIGLGWYQLVNMNKITNDLQQNYDSTLIAEQIHSDFKNEVLHLRNMIVFNKKNEIEKEIIKLQTENEAVTKNIALLDSKMKQTQYKSLLNELIIINSEFNSYKEKLVELVTTEKENEAIIMINNEAQQLHDRYTQTIETIIDSLHKDMDESLTTISKDFRHLILNSSILLTVTLLIIIGIMFRSIYTVSKRLNDVSNAMTDVANGNAELGEKVEVTANDEIDDVARSFNIMVASLEEQMAKEQSLTWVKANVASITTTVSGTHNLEELAQVFLSKVAPLVEASQAVFYIKATDENSRDAIYKMVASYAFKERKHIATTFVSGEGLGGQAVLEKKPIILTNVPSDYIRVSSGLGEATPLTVYVLPVLFEGDVKAVIEIASFQRFNDDQQMLVEELVNGLGVILDSLLGRIKLAKLLEEAQALTEEVQAQSEELQSQQEELRVTNEELEEQTQALRGSEEKLQIQQQELEQTNAELEEKAKVLEEQNNKLELTNREVEQARDELEEKARQLTLSSKYKSEFLANMSHELRSPLNSLLILSKLLAENREGNLTAKQVEFSNTIFSSGSDLLILINDILDLAKIESGRVEVNPNQINLSDLIKYVEQSYRPQATEKNVNFNIVVRDGIPTTLYNDQVRIQQVLRNLLSNAFKFTEEGEITFEIDYLIEQSLFAFSIIDTGIGIPSDKQELIFEAFQQADGSTSRKYGGTGLGLSICRDLSTMLGGKVVVESEEGKGSKFTFFIGNYKEKEKSETQLQQYLLDNVAATEEQPLMTQNVKKDVQTYAAKPSNKQQKTEATNTIKKLLIVDDDVRQRNSLMEFIGDKDVIIKAVSTGAEAIEQLKINSFDCMVLDLGLTDMSGFDLLEIVKANSENEALKVFIYTGRDLTSKEEISLNKYADTIIIKDAHAPQRLQAELELYLNGTSDNAETSDPTVQVQQQRLPYLEGKKVLLVDDDVRNVFALSNILELYGMKITFAENGVEALQILEENSEFDIVLMDIMMPEMDGYEAIRRIRTIPIFHQLPIIALTAKAMKEDREKCMEVGASDYIVKPVDIDKLISLLEVWLYDPEGKNK